MISMKQLVRIFMIAAVVITLAISLGRPGQARPTVAVAAPPAPQVESTVANLLINGDMEMQPYTWFYPNHYVAPYWKRLWYYYSTIPEFDDTRGGPRPNCHECDGGTHAQVYFKWGPAYQAGIYQVVTGVTQCTPYELSAYARNHSVEGAIPHARVALDPEGKTLTPENDGGFFYFAPYTTWSAEQTQLFVWERLAVQAEPLGDRLTAILYASPQPGSNQTPYYYDSYWDAAVLTPVSFPDNHLPLPGTWMPSGFIYDVETTKGSDTLTVNWKTQGAASTQVLYKIEPYQPPISSTVPISLTYHYYFPFIAKAPNPNTFTNYTTLDTTPVTEHSAVITGIRAGDTVLLVPLSRRPLNGSCTTETATPVMVKFDMP